MCACECVCVCVSECVCVCVCVRVSVSNLEEAVRVAVLAEPDCAAWGEVHLGGVDHTLVDPGDTQHTPRYTHPTKHTQNRTHAYSLMVFLCPRAPSEVSPSKNSDFISVCDVNPPPPHTHTHTRTFF